MFFASSQDNCGSACIEVVKQLLDAGGDLLKPANVPENNAHSEEIHLSPFSLAVRNDAENVMLEYLAHVNAKNAGAEEVDVWPSSAERLSALILAIDRSAFGVLLILWQHWWTDDSLRAGLFEYASSHRQERVVQILLAHMQNLDLNVVVDEELNRLEGPQ